MGEGFYLILIFGLFIAMAAVMSGACADEFSAPTKGDRYGWVYIDDGFAGNLLVDRGFLRGLSVVFK